MSQHLAASYAAEDEAYSPAAWRALAQLQRFTLDGILTELGHKQRWSALANAADSDVPLLEPSGSRHRAVAKWDIFRTLLENMNQEGAWEQAFPVWSAWLTKAATKPGRLEQIFGAVAVRGDGRHTPELIESLREHGLEYFRSAGYVAQEVQRLLDGRRHPEVPLAAIVDALLPAQISTMPELRLVKPGAASTDTKTLVEVLAATTNCAAAIAATATVIKRCTALARAEYQGELQLLLEQIRTAGRERSNVEISVVRHATCLLAAGVELDERSHDLIRETQARYREGVRHTWPEMLAVQLEPTPVMVLRGLAALQAQGVDIDASNAEGLTPLHVTIEQRCATSAAALLELGADPCRGSAGGAQHNAIERCRRIIAADGTHSQFIPLLPKMQAIAARQVASRAMRPEVETMAVAP